MSDDTLTDETSKPVVWGSVEYYDKIRKHEYAIKVEEEKRMIDEMLSQITTPEAGRYLMGVITGH